MNLPIIINQDQSWVDIPSAPRAGGRNAARKVQNAKGEMAFFKTPPAHVLGNEVLAYIIASHLNLPCAKVQFAELFGVKGILSFRITGIELVEWPLVPEEIRNNLDTYVMNATDIAKIAVFDVWSYNNDRSTANLILSPKEEWPNKFLVYMIDHEECFYGYNDVCGRHEADGMWLNASGFINIPEVRNSVSLTKIMPFIKKIESLSDNEIRGFINLVPQEYYNPNQADTVFNILQKRRDGLKRIISDWCVAEDKL